ncbi:MAG: 3-phosphoshikimate 1-carboxyvinyltransferase [Cyanobacteria bacterium RUI128]|nr:3-phosphoshikimate 1-carboxyvinyltransferase [Cyanobacteria bacterium RUI128]
MIKKKDTPLNGTIQIPSDKSMSHRSVMFSSLAKGRSIINNFSNGADCISTKKLFEQLGVEITQTGEKSLEVFSNGKLCPPVSDLNCGNSGTTMRLCSGILASRDFDSVLFGDESLSRRPMKRVITPLELMGAKIEADDYKAPLHIYGRQLNGIEYNSPIASAQVKSCILLAGLNADGRTTVIEPYTSRNHTELLLDYMGADIEVNGTSVTVKRSELAPKVINIAGDISSAAYFIVAGLIVPGSEIVIKNVGLNPTRTGIIDIVNRMSGNIEILSQETVSGELVGDIKISYSELKGCTISGEDIPRLIDELPVIALLATQAEGETVVSDAEDLRKKESDRITTIVNGLRSLGADIDEKQDGFVVRGKTKLEGGKTLEVFHDHRLAMTYYTAGLICEKEILINGFEWINISFPEFEKLFNSI